MPAAAHTPAPYKGAAWLRAVCQGTPSLNGGGQTIVRPSFRPEGLQRVDRRRLQN